MRPWFKNPTKAVSERMKRVKSKGTKLELMMESTLKQLGIKYEKQPNLYGHPDFRIIGTSVLLFCDSSFWHGRNEKDLSGTSFKKNREFWHNKIVTNRRRDQRNRRVLRNQGWSVWRFWDTDILKKPEKVRRRLRRIVNRK